MQITVAEAADAGILAVFTLVAALLMALGLTWLHLIIEAEWSEGGKDSIGRKSASAEACSNTAPTPSACNIQHVVGMGGRYS